MDGESIQPRKLRSSITVWIMAVARWPVHALESGVVYKRGYDKSAGNYVYVKYARYGVCVAYFHLSSISVKQGQAVSRGTKVGVAGSTGTSTGVHLHIGVRSLSSWKWQNPEAWLANYSAPSSGGSSSGGSSGYRVGSTYTLRANMNVRTGPGTNYAKKKRSALTANAQGTLYIVQFCRAEIRHAGNLQGCSGRRI